jgi:fucose permease
VLSGTAAFSSGRIIARFGTGPVVLVSCILTGSALRLIAHADGLAWLVIASIPLGFGAGAVDAGLNGYVARHYSGRHMNWLHACWGIGATCGPIVMARSIGSDAGWRGGFWWLSTAQLSLAVLFLLTLRLWNRVPTRQPGPGPETVPIATPTTLANSPAGWLSAAIFAIYVAVEMTTGVWASSILVHSRHLSPEAAGFCASAYYGSITTGRILVGFIVDRCGNRRVIAWGSAVAMIGILSFAFAHTPVTAACSLAVLGLGFAPVYPGLMHEVPRRFAPNAVQTIIGRQSGASALGAAFLPATAGWIAGFSLEAIVWIVGAGVGGLALALRRLDRMT